MYENLIIEYQEFLKGLARKYKHHGYEDIYQQGVLLLIEAHTRGRKHIRDCVSNGIRRYCKGEDMYQGICKGGDDNIE